MLSLVVLAVYLLWRFIKKTLEDKDEVRLMTILLVHHNHIYDSYQSEHASQTCFWLDFLSYSPGLRFQQCFLFN